MNIKMHFGVMFLSILIVGKSYGKETNLLQDGFAAVAVSRESIEAICVQAIEQDYDLYAQLGADWNEDSAGNNMMLAGLHVIEERKILFMHDDTINMSEIAFENVRPKNHIKLSRADIAEINEAMIISHIQTRAVNPQTFEINLEEK